MIWAILAIGFANQRNTCIPLFSSSCLSAAWQHIGDLVLFVWVGKDWATLVSGLLALGAALIGASYLKQQIDQSDNFEKIRRAKKQASVKAILPLALDSCVTYAEASGETLKELRERCVQHALPMTGQAPQFPSIPEDIVSTLRQAVEFSKNTIEEKLFSKIISELQIQRARLKGIEEAFRMDTRTILSINIDRYILQTAEIHALAQSLFEYARGKTEEVPESFDNDGVYRSLRIMSFDESEFPELYAMAQRSYPQI